MDLAEFNDTCVIARNAGAYDEHDNLINAVIYSGPCLYEERSQTNADRMVTRYPMLFLPSNDRIVLIDDTVLIRTFKGRKIEGVVESVRDISFKFKKENITRISLKKTTERRNGGLGGT